MQDNEKKPALRFKGFTDPWEQRKISELAEKTYGGGTPTTSNEAFWNGNIPWIQSSDIVDGKLMGVEPRKYITQTGLNNSATQLVPKDSIAIITRVGVGKLAYMPFSYSTSQDFLSLSKLNTEPFFTVYACYKKLQSELNTVQGTSIKGITKDELLAKTISVPVYSEQKQIGSFFTQLDTLITLHQRKYEKLVNIKKSMLDKMFPKNGASVPEIRFKGFTDLWEQRKLGEIAVFSKGVGYSKNDLCEEGTPIILYGRLYTKYETCVFDVDTFVKEKAGSVYSKGGEVIVPASGETAEDISIASVVVKPGILLGGDLNIVSPTAEYDSAFLALTISSGATHKYLSSLAQGKSVVHLHNSDIQSVSAKFPTKREQEKIHLIFGKIDTLITLHQRKLEKLQNIKKSCLEKMFV